jgi:hypothetical protein
MFSVACAGSTIGLIKARRVRFAGASNFLYDWIEHTLALSHESARNFGVCNMPAIPRQ